MLKLNFLGWVALILAIIGALNWGLIGIFDFDLVGAVFGEMSALSRIIYILVGLAAIYMLVVAMGACKVKWHETHKPHPA